MRFDRSTYALLAANIANGVLAIVQGWSLATIMWIYFSQSIAIGLFTFVRSIGISFQNPVTPMESGGIARLISKVLGYLLLFGGPLFFIFHYGGFHFFYGLLLLGLFPGEVALTPIMAGAGIFFLNHLYSYFFHERHHARGQETIITQWLLMKAPYARILPMNFTILAFAFFMKYGVSPGLPLILLFLTLKTAVDVAAHQREHALKNATSVESQLGLLLKDMKKNKK